MHEFNQRLIQALTQKIIAGVSEKLKWNIICGYTLYKRIYTFNNISSPFSPFCFVIFAF